MQKFIVEVVKMVAETRANDQGSYMDMVISGDALPSHRSPRRWKSLSLAVG